MQINTDLLENTCRNAIETILLSLKHATIGTIYRVGPMPELQIVRVTSGIRAGPDGTMNWGLPQISDYNPPGRTWVEYRDEPGHILEAMAWCVEQQKSWTADDPRDDARSVRKQLRGEVEDCHHMEPVLVKKTDLYGSGFNGFEYPLDWQGNRIWQNTEYVVVAVMKIHFLPQTIRRSDESTKIIKRLSHSLGTELLSLHLRETYLQARQRLSLERLQACNNMAHELRNTLAKMGFIFSTINTVVGFLRAQWEIELEKVLPSSDRKITILGNLSKLLLLGQPQIEGQSDLMQLSQELLAEQNELANLFLLPHQEAEWLTSRIRPKWNCLLTSSRVWEEQREEIEHLLDHLQQAIWIVVDRRVAQRLVHLPEYIRIMWPKLIYTQFSAENSTELEEVLTLLKHPVLNIRQKHQIKKALSSLRVLLGTISGIEEQVNRVIGSLKTGEQNEMKYTTEAQKSDRSAPCYPQCNQGRKPSLTKVADS